MTRFAKYAAPLFAVALLLALTPLGQADDKQNADISLDGASLGTHVLGPELEMKDLKGKVVLFKYWGDRCPPCIASIPHVNELRGEYSADKLVIVANQVWTKKTEATKAAWEKAKGSDKITVVNHGALKGADHRGVPHAYLLDHNGKLIWRGNPHPRADGKALDAEIKQAVAALPDKA